MSIVLIDTTILCNLVQVPSKHQNYDEVMQQLTEFIEQDYTLLLPVTTIIETGNHIAQNGNGNERRQAAERFSILVNDAINGNAPWTIPNPFFSQDDLARYLNEFADNAMRGIGIGDLSIIKEYEHQCELHPARRIFIWSFDGHLMGYERNAPEWAYP